MKTTTKQKLNKKDKNNPRKLKRWVQHGPHQKPRCQVIAKCKQFVEQQTMLWPKDKTIF